MRAVLADECLFLAFLDGHRIEGTKIKQFLPRHVVRELRASRPWGDTRSVRGPDTHSKNNARKSKGRGQKMAAEWLQKTIGCTGIHHCF